MLPLSLHSKIYSVWLQKETKLAFLDPYACLMKWTKGTLVSVLWWSHGCWNQSAGPAAAGPIFRESTFASSTLAQTSVAMYG